METRNNLFTVSFNSQLGPLKILPSIEKSSDGTVIGFAGQSFTIHLTAHDQEKPYAAKLFIDMQEVVAHKTFKKRGSFFGFMKGGGTYEQFVFQIPEFCSENQRNLDSDLKRASKQMGEIRIVFFNAHEVWKKLKPDFHKDNSGRAPNASKFESVPQQDAKAVQYRSLSVAVGHTFKINPAPSFAFQLQDGNHDNMVRSTKADFEEVVDQIVLRYSNPPTLIATGLLSPFAVEHFKHFPTKFLQENEEILVAMLQVLQKPANNKKDAKAPSSDELRRTFEEELGVATQNVWAAGWESLHRKATAAEPKSKDHLMQLILAGKMSKFCQIKELASAGDVSRNAGGSGPDKQVLGKRGEPAPERRYPRPQPQQDPPRHKEPQRYQDDNYRPRQSGGDPRPPQPEARRPQADSKPSGYSRPSQASSSMNPYKSLNQPQHGDQRGGESKYPPKRDYKAPQDKRETRY